MYSANVKDSENADRWLAANPPPLHINIGFGLSFRKVSSSIIEPRLMLIPYGLMFSASIRRLIQVNSVFEKSSLELFIFRIVENES